MEVAASRLSQRHIVAYLLKRGPATTASSGGLGRTRPRTFQRVRNTKRFEMVRKQSVSLGEASNMFDDEDEFDLLYTATAAKQSTTADDDAAADVEVDADADANAYPDDGEPEDEKDEASLGPDSDDEGHPLGQAEMIAGYRVHPAASVFPMMEGKEFEDFKNSIRNNGQRDPVDVHGDVLIEGRNRAKAVELLKREGVDITLQTREWQPEPGQTVAEYVADKNLHRRTLKDDQRVQIAVDLLPIIEQERAEVQKASRIKPGEVRNPAGRNQHGGRGMAEPAPASPSDKAAKNRVKAANSKRGKVASAAKVSKAKAANAIELQKKASPEVLRAVKSGETTQREAMKTIPKAGGSKKAKPYDLETEVHRRWQNFKKQFAAADLPEVREMVQALIKAEGRA